MTLAWMSLVAVLAGAPPAAGSVPSRTIERETIAMLTGSASSGSGVAPRPIERTIVPTLVRGTPGARGVAFDPGERKLVASLALQLARTAPAARKADAAAPPACIGDVCQPRVSVPGYEPRLSTRGKRTELAAQLLSRANIQPLASVARFLVVTGLRLDVTPAALESGPSRTPEGWGHAELALRWRIDAFGKPVWAVVR